MRYAHNTQIHSWTVNPFQYDVIFTYGCLSLYTRNVYRLFYVTILGIYYHKFQFCYFILLIFKESLITI